MANKTAERSEPGPGVGRTNNYGSGSAWSGERAAMLFSPFQTLCLGGRNPRPWLTASRSGCAEAGGRAPEDRERCPPWDLTAERRRARGGDEEVGVADTS